MKACDICGANCGPEDMGEYDEKTGIYACSFCIYEEDGPMDLEDQLDAALSKVTP